MPSRDDFMYDPKIVYFTQTEVDSIYLVLAANIAVIFYLEMAYYFHILY